MTWYTHGRYHFISDDTRNPFGFEKCRLICQKDFGGQSDYETMCFLPNREIADRVVTFLNSPADRGMVHAILTSVRNYTKEIANKEP